MGELKLGQFTVNLVNMIGQGGFGVVYGGKDTKTGKKVAVKMIRITTEQDGHDAMKEIKTFDRLTEHPNLIRLLDFHYMNRAFWMIMDFCDAGDIDKYVCKQNPDLAEKLTMMFQTACAIAHMHESKPPMIHRDIKPANILLFKQSDGKLIVKVSDFGLSKMASNSAATALFTTLAGTPGFLAPEVFLKKPYTFSVDVFSLGLVFLAMIQHTKGDRRLFPRFVNRTDMAQIGVEMNSAARDGKPQPKLCIVEHSDKPELQKLKSTKDRCKAIDVATILGQITGHRVIQGAAEAKAKAAPAPSNDKAQADDREGLTSRLMREAVKEKMKGDKKASDQRRTEMLELMGMVELFKMALGGSDASEDEKKLGVGDRVRVTTDKSKAMRLQEHYGGWNSSMTPYLGKVGVIKAKLPNGIKVKGGHSELINTVKVQFSDGKVWAYNPELLQYCDVDEDNEEDSTRPFKRYDVVLIDKDISRARQLQKGHGGWTSSMAAVLGLKGIVSKVDSDGDVLVECINSSRFFFNPALLKKVDTSHMTFQEGDFVLVIDSYQKVKALQDSDHGGWNEKMRECLGRGGVVSGVLSSARVRVNMGKVPWIFNSKALVLIAKSEEMMQAVLREYVVG